MIPNIVIPEQNFEIVRDAIGLVLKEELDAKIALAVAEGSAIDLGSPTVYVDLWDAPDPSKLPAVIVYLVSDNFTNQDTRSAEGLATYYVDVYARSKSNQNEHGYRVSHKILTRIMGMIRFILSSPQYARLGLDTTQIKEVIVASMGIVTEADKQDASNTAFGRVVVTVRMNEANNPSGEGNPLQISSTKFRLAESETGIYWEYNIPE